MLRVVFEENHGTAATPVRQRVGLVLRLVVRKVDL